MGPPLPHPLSMVQSDVKRLESIVMLFIANITIEINFSSKVYSKSLLKGSPMSCTSLQEVISCPEVWRPIFCKSKENQCLIQEYGDGYFAKVKRIDILS